MGGGGDSGSLRADGAREGMGSCLPPCDKTMCFEIRGNVRVL